MGEYAYLVHTPRKLWAEAASRDPVVAVPLHEGLQHVESEYYLRPAMCNPGDREGRGSEFGQPTHPVIYRPSGSNQQRGSRALRSLP